MVRKYGRKNVIKVNPLAYNLGLFGESGIGKSSTVVEYCESLAGEDGYLLLNIGREDGVDAIPNAMFENIPDWDAFEDFVNDVIENRNTDYKDLQVIAYDTLDELFRIAEPQVIKMHNRESPSKPVKTVKAAFGGFQAGEDKAIDIVIDKLWSLKDIGISMIVIGHTKRKSTTDIATGDEYDMLTANMSPRYFNAIKSKLHFLGVASVDRTIDKKRVKQIIGDDKVVGKVVGESRIITFRDDNFNIDSKSRFKEIVPRINLYSQELIVAVKDAIKKAHDKQGGEKSIEETAKEQNELKANTISSKLADLEDSKIDAEKNTALVIEFKELYNNASEETKMAVSQYFNEHSISLKDYINTPTAKLQEAVNLLK